MLAPLSTASTTLPVTALLDAAATTTTSVLELLMTCATGMPASVMLTKLEADASRFRPAIVTTVPRWPDAGVTL